MKGFLRFAVTLFFAACLIQTAGAVTIDYELNNIEGNSWRYDYTITKDSSDGTVVAWLDIMFDYRYGNLELDVDPWDPWEDGMGMWNDLLVMWTNPNIEEKIYGFLTLISDDPAGISFGDYLKLSVIFNWLGEIDEPVGGSQEYIAWGDSGDSFEPLPYEGGTTDVSSKYPDPDVPEPPQVPEPGTLVLLGTGIVGLAAYYRRSREAGKR